MTHHDEHQEHTERKEITIETLSAPPLQIRPAPLPRRIAAAFVDSLILVLAWIILMLASGQNSPIPTPGSLRAVTVAYLAALVFSYYFLMEGIFAATVGKYLLKLRVFGKNGELCSFGAAFKRNLFRIVDWLPFLYVVAAIAIIATKDRQRIGDRLAGTIVSRAPEKDINPHPAPFLFH